MGRLPMFTFEHDEKIEKLEQQLEKANERIALLERVEEIFNESPELTFDNVKGMFSDELNKFAIEMKCKAIDVFSSAFIEANYKHDVPSVGGVHNECMRNAILNALQKAAEKSIEQLRKEQE